MSESLEVASLRRLAAAVGARVTDVSTPGVHSPTSYHYAAGTDGIGLAIDLAEATPSHDTPGLLKIATQVALAIGPQCAELIYAGGPCLRNGKPFRYAADILAAHHNHVHVAVNRGFRFNPEVKPMFAPPLSICAVLPAPNSGAWCLAPDGAIYAFAAPYLGGANGQPYFVGRTAARLEPFRGGYTIVATSGERYDYPAS